MRDSEGNRVKHLFRGPRALPRIARWLGSKRWVMKLAPVIIPLDRFVHWLSLNKSSLLGFADLPSLSLLTTGRKSGLPRSTHLLYYPHEEGFLIVGSNWGRPQQPAWAHNLRANPSAGIVIRGKQISVQAREAQGAEYDELWGEVLEFWPGYAMEQESAGRVLPLFMLTPQNPQV